jgi:spore coat polysaccharide biosynthesis predicted glycosyltransferase SpsG
MSAINGDKARFHRNRKKKILRRLRKRKILVTLGMQPEATTLRSELRPKENS